MPRFLCLAALLLGLAGFSGLANGQPRTQVVNGSFELPPENPGEVPGWFLPPTVANGPADIRVVQDVQTAVDGDHALVVTIPSDTDPAVNILQVLDAAAFRGRRVRLTAQFRVRDGATPELPARAQLWMRVDREGGRAGFFDNMADRPVVDSGAWETAVIEGAVHPDATAVYIGLVVLGAGEVAADGVSISPLGPAGPGAFEAQSPPAFDRAVDQIAFPLTERGLRNIRALGAATANVRWFHPADAVAETNWDWWLTTRVGEYERLADDRALARRLQAELAPIAPGVVIWSGSRGEGPEADPDAAWRIAAAAADRATHWHHEGAYSAERVRADVDRTATPDSAFTMPLDTWMPVGFEVVRELVPGVWMRWPARFAANETGSIPPGEPAQPADAQPEDRAIRLAGVLTAWSILDQFYPYFDLIESDWDAELHRALRTAATDRSIEDWMRTMRRMTWALHDGHAGVFHRAVVQSHVLPFGVRWIGESLVVVRPDPEGLLSVGDRIVSLDNRPVAEWREELESTISGSPQWRASRSALQFGASFEPSAVTLDVDRADGSRETLVVNRAARANEPEPEPRPESFSVISTDGGETRYVDLTRITELDLIGRLPELAQADAIVFDLRGYPGQVGPAFLQHLLDAPGHSPIWQVPVYRLPDQAQREFLFSRWLLQPTEPRLTDRVAFLIDGRAISYAESLSATIRFNRLGVLVGSPTAGANGNVVSREVPGRATFSFTGLRVATHTGFSDHVTGVRPDVLVEPTREGIAAGRDEVLERAIEVLNAQRP